MKEFIEAREELEHWWEDGIDLSECVGKKRSTKMV
jgi:Zn ribbon nucleic-acid-binding protein